MTQDFSHESWKYIAIIPIDRIRILNPRARDKRKFQLLVENIGKVGLKRPITVSKRTNANNEPTYDLVCGQGRAEAFMALGQTHIPAMIIEASKDDCLVMSLVENCARRQHSAKELMQAIKNLRQQGYGDKVIAEKIGFTQQHVNMIVNLLEHGEERLLSAVEAGILSLSLATEIAKTDQQGGQAALVEAYNQKGLKGRKLVAARRLLEQRSLKGKRMFEQSPLKANAPRQSVTSETIIKTYQQEAAKQKLLMKKAEVTQSKLLFAVEAMRKLIAEPEFIKLLQAENLDSIPSPLRKRFS